MDNDDALRLREIVEDSNVPRDEILSFGTLTARKGDVAAVILDYEKSDKQRDYNLDDPEDKREIREFEDMFLAFCAANPDKFFTERAGKDGRMWKIGRLEHWMKSLNLIDSLNGMGNYRVIDPRGLRRFVKKWSALQELRWRREFMQERERESQATLIS